MYREMNILQQNVRKMARAQDAIYNDQESGEFDVILLQEPHISTYGEQQRITGTGPNFEAVLLKLHPGVETRKRVGMWVNRKQDFVQINIPNADVVAILINAQKRQVLVTSVYIPCIGTDGAEANGEQLRERLQAIQQAIDQERTQDPSVELIIAGDFNRHDILWEGNHIGNSPRQGEAQQILDFMETNDLQSMLPRGAMTFESGAGESTIDLMLVSQRLEEEKSICALCRTEHGSHHRAIHSAFSMDTANEESVPTVRYMIKQADWTKVRGYIEQHPSRQRFSTLGLDEMEERLVGMVQGALEEHCPKVKPSVYSKRWWNVNLSELRKNYTSIRNKARSRRRQGRMDPEMEATAN